MISMEETYRAHAQMVYRYLLSLCHDADLAEELTQETFYQAVRCANKFDGSCKVSTWLCSIAKNQLAAYRRKHPPVDGLLDDEDWLQAQIQSQSRDVGGSADGGGPGGGASPETQAIASEERVRILKELRRLEGDVREVVYLRLFGELSFAEIGEVLSRSENWARVTYYRAKERLKRQLGDA